MRFPRPNRHALLLVPMAIALLGPLPPVSASDPAAPPPQPAATAVPATRTATLDGLPAADGVSAASAVGESVGAVVTAPVEAPIEFAMVGLELPGDATARLRVSDDGGTWSAWEATERLAPGVDGPDVGTDEAIAAGEVDRFTEPVWTGASRWLQVELVGTTPGEVDATFIDTLGLSADDDAAVAAAAVPGDGAVAAAAFAPPTFPRAVSRAAWGADESLRKGPPAYASSGRRYAVIHHTAGGNTYTPSEGPAVVRGILQYHTQVRGWNDIAYNVLVDRYGRVYEGRAGGFDAAVVGAHAQGFNTGSLGVAILGEFTATPPPQVAFDAVADVLAWEFVLHGINPGGGVVITSGGSNKYPAGKQVPMSTIFGHRDAAQTACPGNAYYDRLPQLRAAVSARLGGAPPPPPPPPPTSTFSDIGGSVHAASIEMLARAGITGGCGNGRFCPDGVVTRGQAVSLLVRARGLAPVGGQRFSDVPPTSTHASAINAAVAAGIVTGYADGTFAPDAVVTRDQLASLLAKAKGLARRPGQFFTDVPWTSPHLANVNAIGEARLTTGCGGGRYCPYGITSRGQMATLVAKAFPR